MSDHGLKTIEEVLDQVTGFWRSAIIWAARDLSAADHILAGRDTPQAIAEAGFVKVEQHPTIGYASAIVARKR